MQNPATAIQRVITFSVNINASPRADRTANTKIASTRLKRPSARGRDLVRSTKGSICRSTMSLATQPAARMTKVPTINVQRIQKAGTVSAASQSAVSVGHNNKSVPTGRSRRISSIMALNFCGRIMGLRASLGRLIYMASTG